MPGPALTIKNLKKTKRKFKKMIKALGPVPMERKLLLSMRIVRDEAKRLAPVGETRKLKKSIRAKIGKRKGRRFVSVFAAVNRKRGSGAPHAHLVEQGHDIVKGGKKGKGGRVVGRTRPNPFFRRAVFAKMGEVLKRTGRDVSELLGEAVR